MNNVIRHIFFIKHYQPKYYQSKIKRRVICTDISNTYFLFNKNTDGQYELVNNKAKTAILDFNVVPTPIILTFRKKFNSLHITRVRLIPIHHMK